MTRPDPTITLFGPDFPFAYDDWIANPGGLGTIPPEAHGAEVAIIGSGISGLVCAYELMRMGLKPTVYESPGSFGGRLRSQPFEGAEGVIAELGGMRFPISSTGFYALCRPGRRGERALPQPADRRRRIDRDRYRGQQLLRRTGQ